MSGSVRVRLAGALAGLAVVAVVTACGGSDDPALVTTTSRVVTTAAPTTAADLTTTTAAADLTTTTAADQSDSDSDPPATTADEEQEIGEISFRVARQESTRDGTVLHLEVPPGDYTDVDLENLVLSIYEERDDLYELHVLDSREALSALLTPEGERTPDQKALLESHYLVSFLEGAILRFQGPFANLEGYVVGS